MAKTKFRWLKMGKKTAPDALERPPTWLGNHSNGEYFHEQTPRERLMHDIIMRKADENARRLGMDRREFLASAMGMATSLMVINACGDDDKGKADAGGAGSGGSGGPDGGLMDGGMADGGGGRGGYCVDPNAQFDEDAACAALDGNEFIFDIQTHHFDPDAEWVQTNASYLTIVRPCGLEPREICMSRERYEELMFCDSDTTMAALSTWPAALCTEARRRACGLPLPNEAVAQSRELINMAANSQRIVNHVQIMPNDPAGLERQLAIMEEMHECYGAAAWKLYPAWGPGGTGFFLDDEIGLRVIEKGRELGVKLFCVHKGLPIPGFDVEHNFPSEIGRVAKMFDDCKFIIYHSGICAGQTSCGTNATEGPYDPDNVVGGSDTLIKSLEEAGVAPGSNVYAELGSAFSQVMNNPTRAQHFIGKLLKHVGTDNVCWGTDCILYGSPQELIQRFRTFTISEEFQEMYGYPALDAQQRAKIFGLNAAEAYGVNPDAIRCQLPSCEMAYNKRMLDEELGPRRWVFRQPLGPRTRRSFLQLAKEHLALGVPG